MKIQIINYLFRQAFIWRHEHEKKKLISRFKSSQGAHAFDLKM